MVAAFVAMLPTAAGAHAYTGQYTWRLYKCGDPVNELACQAHYVLAVDSPLYGPLWKVQHSHGCTSKTSSIFDGWWYQDFKILDHTGAVAWKPWDHMSSEPSHLHTSQWCGWSAGTHEFYPDTYVPRGNNKFYLWTAAHLTGGGASNDPTSTMDDV